MIFFANFRYRYFSSAAFFVSRRRYPGPGLGFPAEIQSRLFYKLREHTIKLSALPT